MDFMDRDGIADALIQLGNANEAAEKILEDYWKKSNRKRKFFLTEEAYVINKVGTESEYVEKTVAPSEDDYVNKVLPLPTEKPTTATVEKPITTGKVTFWLCALCLTAIIAVALLIGTVRGYSLRNAVEDIRSNHGTAYDTWINSFGNFESFDQLEAGWKAVEEDWGERGVDADWNFVITAKNKAYPNGGTIYSDSIDRSIMKELKELSDDALFLDSTQLPVLVLLLVLVVVFAVRFKKAYDFWSWENRRCKEAQRTIDENIEYNKNLPNLIKERDKKIPNAIAEYHEKVKAARAEYPEKVEAAHISYQKEMGPILKELAPHTEVIEKYGHLLPSEGYYFFATYIGERMIVDDIDSVADAMEKIFVEEHPDYAILLDRKLDWKRRTNRK